MKFAFSSLSDEQKKLVPIRAHYFDLYTMVLLTDFSILSKNPDIGEVLEFGFLDEKIRASLGLSPDTQLSLFVEDFSYLITHGMINPSDLALRNFYQAMFLYPDWYKKLDTRFKKTLQDCLNASTQTPALLKELINVAIAEFESPIPNLNFMTMISAAHGKLLTEVMDLYKFELITTEAGMASFAYLSTQIAAEYNGKKNFFRQLFNIESSENYMEALDFFSKKLMAYSKEEDKNGKGSLEDESLLTSAIFNYIIQNFHSIEFFKECLQYNPEKFKSSSYFHPDFLMHLKNVIGSKMTFETFNSLFLKNETAFNTFLGLNTTIKKLVIDALIENDNDIENQLGNIVNILESIVHPNTSNFHLISRTMSELMQMGVMTKDTRQVSNAWLSTLARGQVPLLIKIDEYGNGSWINWIVWGHKDGVWQQTSIHRFDGEIFEELPFSQGDTIVTIERRDASLTRPIWKLLNTGHTFTPLTIVDSEGKSIKNWKSQFIINFINFIANYYDADLITLLQDKLNNIFESDLTLIQSEIKAIEESFMWTADYRLHYQREATKEKSEALELEYKQLESLNNFLNITIGKTALYSQSKMSVDIAQKHLKFKKYDDFLNETTAEIKEKKNNIYKNYYENNVVSEATQKENIIMENTTSISTSDPVDIHSEEDNKIGHTPMTATNEIFNSDDTFSSELSTESKKIVDDTSSTDKVINGGNPAVSETRFFVISTQPVSYFPHSNNNNNNGSSFTPMRIEQPQKTKRESNLQNIDQNPLWQLKQRFISIKVFAGSKKLQEGEFMSILKALNNAQSGALRDELHKLKLVEKGRFTLDASYFKIRDDLFNLEELALQTYLQQYNHWKIAEESKKTKGYVR